MSTCFMLVQFKKVKMHTYIAPLEAQFHLFLISGTLHITSPAWLLHPTCLPSKSMALLVLIYTWVEWSLVNLKQGSVQPKLPQFWLWSVLNPQTLTHEPRTIPLHHWGQFMFLCQYSLQCFTNLHYFMSKQFKVCRHNLHNVILMSIMPCYVMHIHFHLHYAKST